MLMSYVTTPCREVPVCSAVTCQVQRGVRAAIGFSTFCGADVNTLPSLIFNIVARTVFMALDVGVHGSGFQLSSRVPWLMVKQLVAPRTCFSR